MGTVRAGTSLAVGLALSDLTLNDLWFRYFELTGTESRGSLQSYLAGETAWSEEQHDVAVQALNEYFTEHGMDHPIPSSEDL